MEDKLIPSSQQNKLPLENMSKDEIITKYISLLGIAKKVKQAKDEILEENNKLKELVQKHENQEETDKKTLMTLQELLESYTEQKLELTNEVSGLQKQRQHNLEMLDELRIENESMKRQLNRLSDENELLLSNLQRMEHQLLQVEVVGKDQKHNLVLLEDEVNKLKQKELLNEELTIQITENNFKIKQLKEKYNSMKTINTEQKHKFNILKDRFIEVLGKLKKLKECKKILLETQYEYSNSISQWQSEIIQASERLCIEFQNLKAENIELLEKLAKQKQIEFNDLIEKQQEDEKTQDIVSQQDELLEQLSLESKNLLNKLSDTELRLTESNQALEKSRNDFENLQIKIKDLEGENHMNIQNMVQKIEILTKEKQALLEQYENIKSDVRYKEEESYIMLKDKLERTQKSLQDVQTSQKNKEKEHTELLDEMRELNEALKTRGDMISRQQDEQKKLKIELKKNSNRLNDFQQMLELKEKQIEDKQSQLTSVSNEISISQQKIESLEKLCALNEEKVIFLNSELETLRSSCLQNITTSDNQSDVISTSNSSRADDLANLHDVEDINDDKYKRLRIFAVKLKKKLQEQITLNEKLEEEISIYKSKESEIQQQLNKEHKTTAELENLRKQLSEFKADNQKLRSSRKQANVLNLEIEATERSLRDVSEKLEARNIELSEAQEILKAHELTNKQLTQEIQSMKWVKESDLKHMQDLKEQVNHLQRTVKSAIHDKQQAYDKCKCFEKDTEQLKLELETTRLELSKSISQHEQNVSTMNMEKEMISQNLIKTQELLIETEKRLKYSERTIEDLRLEYLDYKVKAQAVLRKNQQRDISKERELQEEVLSVRAIENQLNNTIEILNSKLESLEKCNECLNDSNRILQERVDNLLHIIDELRDQNESLNVELQQQVQQQHEVLKQHRIQIESLNMCHREQIMNNQKELEKLQKELSLMGVRVPPIIGDESHQINSNDTTDLLHLNNNNINKTDILTMEREDAEGSEEGITILNKSLKTSNISSIRKRSQHDFIPLDELLETPINAINSELLITGTNENLVKNGNNKNISEFIQIDLDNMKINMQRQESKIRHLTSILAENEQDLAKLTQMNEMLKDELRRQERSTERQHHMHNSEYMKNVIIKFLTLNHGDEKSHLVPVLNTILKLTREETEILNCIAKGQKVNVDTIGLRAGSNSGWGQYFTLWSNKNS